MSGQIIGDILPYTQAIATGGQTVFGTNWTADTASDVVVYQTPFGDDADDATQILPYPAGYSVAFIGSLQEVEVTLTNPASAGDRITITRQTPADRENLYTNTNFTPSMLNNDFGILTLVDQQAQLVDQKIGPRYNYSAIIVDVVDTILPILGANQIWVKNNDDDAIIALDVPSSGFAPTAATFVLLEPEASLPNSFPLSSLGNGVLINDSGSNTLLSRLITGTANVTQVTNGNGLAGNINITLVDNPLIPGTAGMGIPQGTTAQRVVPASGISFRYNTDSGRLEFWDGVTWTELEDSTDFSSLPTGFVTVTNGSGALNSRTLVATANQIDITNTNGAGNPVFSLSSTLNLPGTFDIQSSTAVDSIINDPTMAAATTMNLSTSTAIKTYVDSLVTGLNIQGSCVAGSTVALTVTYNNGAAGIGATLTNAGVQAAFSLDGVSPTVTQRVLIKNQASSLQNGIYTVTDVGSGATDWVLTRATDYDTPAEIQPGDFVILTGGTTQANSSWIQTATVTTIGVDAITFIQFSASLPVNVASGGTGRTSFTAYGILAGGTTATGSLQQVTIGASGTILQSGGASALPTFSTATYPSVATGTGTILRADGTNWVPSTATYPNTASVAGAFLRADGTNWVASTLTIPNTASINTIPYASIANVWGEISAANNSVLATGGTGIPAWIPKTSVIGSVIASRITATGAFTYTPTTGMQFVRVRLAGGSGGGGGVTGAAGQTSAASGGNAGGYLEFYMTAAQVGASINGSVGTGGAGGAAGNNNGAAGGNTTFGDWTAVGGNGGLGCAAAATSQQIGVGATLSNTTGTGTILSSIASNSANFAFTLTTVLAVNGGSGGGNPLGAKLGSITLVATGAVAGAGNLTRGGGNGAISLNTAGNLAGGAGGAGIVLLEEFIAVA